MIKLGSGYSECDLLAVYVSPEESPMPTPFVRKTWLHGKIDRDILPNWTDLIVYVLLRK